MSSESDGEGSPRGWTLVDRHGHPEDSEDTSGSSSDFVDLGEDVVRYHHVSRCSSVIDIAPGNLANSSSFSSSSLPANFRAHGGASKGLEDAQESVSPDNKVLASLPRSSGIPENAEIFSGDGAVRPRTCSNRSSVTHLTTQERGGEEGTPAGNKQSSDLENSISSSASTLTGSQGVHGSHSPLLAFCSNDVVNTEDYQDADTFPEILATSLTSRHQDEDGEASNLEPQAAGSASDNISVDSIEVLSMPSEESSFLEDGSMLRNLGAAIDGRREEVEDEQRLEVAPGLLTMATLSPEPETDLHHNEPKLSSENEESDTSEFERIDPETVPASDEVRNQTIDAAEEGKTDVAGARPTEEAAEEPLSDISFLRPLDQPQNCLEMPSHESEDLQNTLPRLVAPSPAIKLMSTSSDPPASHINHWAGQSVASIQPFPFDYLSSAERIGLRQRASSSESSAGFHFQLPGRFGMHHRHHNCSSDEGFELLRRPRRRDDDEVSTLSSSSSDLSGFVNVRQQRGPPLSRSVSQRHSDFDDTLDSVSNFTDLSEDCLPANMMIQSQKSGVKQYRHRRDDGLNTRLDWLVAMVLLAGLALGIGHFIGSSQEMAHQHSINTGQVQRLRELQDDLVTCLDRSSGIDSRITTEETSPALQAVKLLEGLNSKMMEEGLDTSRLLEQKVGGEEPQGAVHGGLQLTEETENVAVIDSGETDEKVVDQTVLETQPSSHAHFGDGTLESVNSLDDSESENVHRTEEDIGLGQNAEEAGDELSSVQHDSSDDQVKILVDDSVASVESKMTLDSVVDEEVEKPQDASCEGEDLGDKQVRAHSVDGELVRGSSKECGHDHDEKPKLFEYYDEKIESLEEKMEELMETAQQWQKMFEESQNKESPGEAETERQKKEESSSKDQDDQDGTEEDGDPLGGIGGTLQGLWSNWLATEHGKAILHYLNQTQEQSVLWSNAVLQELKALPDSEQVQAVLNNSKLLAKHLGKEIRSAAGYLKNQSAKLAEENNITAEGVGEKASNAWNKFKNITSDVLEYNKKVLSAVGEQLVDTVHTVENISSEFIAEQNLSLSRVTNMAEQAWERVKNYSSTVTESILNRTSETTKTSSQKEFVDEPETEPDGEAPGGFGEKLRGAWDTVRNYSSNLTSKQNLSISGLREQVKAAWGRVKNTSAQVMEDISESNLAEKLKDGAKNLGEKVGTTIKSVKEKVKEFHRGKKKKHRNDHSCRHQAERGRNKKHKKKNHKRNGKQSNKEDYPSRHSHKKNTHKKHNKHHGHAHHKKQYSVPSRWHHQHQQYDDEFDTENIHSTTDLDQDYLNSAPSRSHWSLPSREETGPAQEDNQKQDKMNSEWGPSLEQLQNSVPSRQQMKDSSDGETQDQSKSKISGSSIPEEKQSETKSVPSGQPMVSPDARSHPSTSRSGQEGLNKDEKATSKEDGCLPKRGLESGDDGESDTISNWEELFDCIDMHCRGNEKCMHSQRRDAARLYSELLDYQEWLKERNLKKDVRELKEFLEELGEFLSETDSDDEDLDELKDEFGEMVQDMEEGALKRQRKKKKYRDHKPLQSNKDHRLEEHDITQDLDDAENSTVVIDLQTLPQKQHVSSDSQSHRHKENADKRKYAGRGFHSTDDGNDWYLRRAEVRAEQRKSHRWSGNENPKDTSNWYLQWVQGRINGRTGVTVWDMYEWIKERYMVREELRRHDMEDHTNWFLRRP